MDSFSGQKIGRYEVESHLASGGMGSVYIATDPQTNRKVAIKLLPTLHTSDEKKRTRFIQELQTVAQLEHDAIVSVYDTGEHDNNLFFVMRYIKGGTLSEKIPVGGMSLPDVIALFRRIGPALDMAHGRGIFHRDLKPQNILFDKQGKGYISDFGIAKVSQSDHQLSHSGAMMGTSPYMAPEQFTNEAIDARTDVYALGIILFEALTGETPFKGSSIHEWVHAHLQAQPPTLSTFRAGLPFALELIAEKALAKKPEDRYQSVGEMVRALEGVPLPLDDETFGETASYERTIYETRATVTSSTPIQRPTASPFPRWAYYLLGGVLIVALLAFATPRSPMRQFLAGAPPSPTVTPTLEPTSPPTETPTVETAVSISENFIFFVQYDPATAIYQTGENALARIPANAQLPLPTDDEPLTIQSNSGRMQIRLPDSTLLYLEQNSTIQILELKTADQPDNKDHIFVEKGAVAILNDNTPITIAAQDVETQLFRGVVEVNSDATADQISIDCIQQTCPITFAEEDEIELGEGEALIFNSDDQTTTQRGARYSLFNRLTSNLNITPTPTSTATPTPTSTPIPTPTPAGSTTVDIGFSNSNAPIEAVRFGNGPVDLFFIGGIHSGSAPGTVLLAEQVITYYEDNPAEIPASVTLHVIPNLNPDSVAAPGQREGRYNARGVDLNRNWDCDHAVDPVVVGSIERGRGGPEPFSEPETAALRDYVFEQDPAAIVFWMAAISNGIVSPGACGGPTAVSGQLTELYSNASNYPYDEDFEATVGFTFNGDAMNYLDDQGYPTIAVLLRDHIETDFQRNLLAVQAVIRGYQNGFYDPPLEISNALPDEIVFQSNRDGDFEIYIANVNGSEVRQLTNNSADDRYPRVSPDGTKIVFESDRDGQKEIYVINRDGTNPRRITFNEIDERLPSWSPDGFRILYHAIPPDGEKAELYSVSLGGGAPSQLTDTDFIEAHVSLSENGRLLYNGREATSDNWQLFTANSDGSDPTALTDGQLKAWSGEWSPNGQRIVYVAELPAPSISGIGLMNADGSGLQILYDDPAAIEWGPSWSASNTQVVFTIDQPDGTADIFIMNVNDPDSAQRIIERGSYPSWAGAIGSPGSIPLPTPTPSGDSPAGSTSPTSSSGCVNNALRRWQSSIYPEFASRLGCPTSSEKQLTGVFQIFENGIMVWRGDSNSIYVLYTDGTAINTFQRFDMDNVAPLESENPLLKGSIGLLWTANTAVQNKIGNPTTNEMGVSDFVLQEFANGTLFYFSENLANTYLLLGDQNEFRMIQEK